MKEAGPFCPGHPCLYRAYIVYDTVIRRWNFPLQFQKGQLRRYNVPNARKIFQQSWGTDTWANRTVGHGEKENWTATEPHAAKVSKSCIIFLFRCIQWWVNILCIEVTSTATDTHTVYSYRYTDTHTVCLSGVRSMLTSSLASSHHHWTGRIRV